MDIFGTLGFTPAKYLPTVRERSDVDRAVVFHNDHADSQAAAREVARYCHGLGVPCKTLAVDAFDLVACAEAMQQEVRRSARERILFDVTGGTKVLTAAAVLTCILEGVRAVYRHEETGEEVPLPLVTARYENLLSTQQRRVLQYVAAHPGTSQQDTCKALRLTKPTVSHHIHRLVESGLLRQSPHPEDGRRKALHVIPSARLLVGPQEE